MKGKNTSIPSPQPLRRDDETLARFWCYYAQFPETYFSYRHGLAFLRVARPKRLKRKQDRMVT